MKSIASVTIVTLLMLLPSFLGAVHSCSGEFSIAYGECQDLYSTTIWQDLGITPQNPNCGGSCHEMKAACEGGADRAYERCISR